MKFERQWLSLSLHVCHRWQVLPKFSTANCFQFFKGTHISLDVGLSSCSQMILNLAMVTKSPMVLQGQPARRNAFDMLQLLSLKMCSTLKLTGQSVSSNRPITLYGHHITAETQRYLLFENPAWGYQARKPRKNCRN